MTPSFAVIFWSDSRDSAEHVTAAIRETFLDAAIHLEELDSFAETKNNLVDSYFNVVVEGCDVTIIVAPIRLQTAFGRRLAGEAREHTVVLSGPLITQINAVRLVRHEIGHVFGLDEHLDCVMSPYAAEIPKFCSKCTLHLSGILKISCASGAFTGLSRAISGETNFEEIGVKRTGCALVDRGPSGFRRAR